MKISESKHSLIVLGRVHARPSAILENSATSSCVNIYKNVSRKNIVEWLILYKENNTKKSSFL